MRPQGDDRPARHVDYFLNSTASLSHTYCHIKHLGAVFVVGAIPQKTFAGAWAQPQGRFYTKLSSTFYHSDEVFDESGDRHPVTIYGSEFRAIQGFLYIEYGVTRRLTAITQLSGSSLQSESNVRHNVLRLNTSGLGDVVIGAKFQLVGEPIVLSPYLSVKIPTYYDNDLNPALGTGDADVELKVLTARSFHPLPLFIGMEAGYRARDGPFSNQIRFSGEAGATPSSRLSFKAYLEESKTLSGDIRLAEPGLVQVSEGDFTKLGLIAGFRARGPLWMEVALESVLAGKNVSAGHAWGLALSYSHR